MVGMGWGQDRMGQWGWDGGMRTGRWDGMVGMEWLDGDQGDWMVRMGMVGTAWDSGDGVAGWGRAGRGQRERWKQDGGMRTGRQDGMVGWG